MKKKIISMCLVLCMCLTLVTPALATTPPDILSDTTTVYYLGHGEYTTDPATRSATNNYYSNSILATVSEYTGMLAVSETSYLTPTGINTYLLVDKIDINTDNFDANLATLETYDIPVQRIDDIRTTIAEQKEFGNNELQVVVFAPPTERNQNEVGSLSRSASNSFYYYQGYDFKDTITLYSNMSSGMIKKDGADTKNIANAFVNFVVSTAGIASKSISVFGAGLSALSVYEALHGSVTKGSTGDQIYSNLIYDKRVKDTYVWSDVYNDWDYVFASDHVDLTRCETYQYYSEHGKGELTAKSLSVSMSTEHYDNPAKEVVDWGFSPPWDGPISAKVQDTIVYL